MRKGRVTIQLTSGETFSETVMTAKGSLADPLSDRDIEAKLREALKAGVPKPLTTNDLATAAASLKPTTKEWFATARNHALYSNQGGTYDDILKYLKLT